MAGNRTDRTPKKARARKAPSKGGGTRKPDWTKRFLEEFEKTALVIEACRRADVARSTVYERRKTDKEFAAAWQEIEDNVVERMEAEAHRRAVDGVERRSYDKDGNLIREEQVYSDTLLMFLLKARRPHVYRENVRHEHSGPGGAPIAHAVDGGSVKVRKFLDQALEASVDAEPAD